MTTASELPATKISTIWGLAAGSGYIRTPPVASQIGIQNGAASFSTGFAPLNFVPTQTGGVPPFGQDMNGVLNIITAWQQWQQMGGPIYYDPVFSAAIGGYPKGAVLPVAANVGMFWVSTVDNNTSNPDTGGAGWTLAPQGINNAWTGTNSFSQTVTGAQGFTATQVDAGAAHFRAINGNYGAFFQNNGVSALFLQTASGSQYGVANAFRPLGWNLSSGVVTIDATGAGVTMGGSLAVSTITSSGPLTINANVTLNGNITTPYTGAYGALNLGGLPVATQAYAAALPGRLLAVQVFTGAGAQTYTPWAGATKTRCTIQGAAGPGGSTVATSGGQAAVGGGGGSGALAEVLINLAGISSLALYLGGAGTAAAGTAGANGGVTTVTSGANTLVSVPGGMAAPLGTAVTTAGLYSGAPGGVTAYPTYYEAGGTPLLAIIRNTPGQAGHTGILYATGGVVSGRGADGPYGGAGGASSSAAGNAGAGYGAGGSGAGALVSTAAEAGGSGVGAIIVFEDFT